LNFWQSALTEDMHVHSTFSDGLHSPAENIRQAEQVGLKRLCCVDHVRRDTEWLGDFVMEDKSVESSIAAANFFRHRNQAAEPSGRSGYA
jgi:histidinol phosphatase-like PHP family hydrolase